MTIQYTGVTPQEAEEGGWDLGEVEQLTLDILSIMDNEAIELSKYRDYYEGDQALVYGTEKFKATFGDSFEAYKDNWCGVVAGAVLDRLRITGIRVGTMTDEQKELSREIWTALQRNDFDEQQRDAHEGGVVEGRFAVIVWPDESIGARVDWNPGTMVQVVYDDDDERRAIFAVKRWITSSNEVWVNSYTEDDVYKFKVTSSGQTRSSRRGVLGAIARNASGGLEPREVAGEEWPLPNPFGVVPVVEFYNARGSEIKDVIPQQDAINYMMIQTMVSGEYASFSQRVMMTGARPPAGGWNNVPGQVWRIPPTVDAEGKMMQGEIGEFKAADLSQFRQVVDMMLMHLALTSKTPVRYFFTSDRGGRGDAPSGESLKVEDGPLNKKVEDSQTRFGNRWYAVAKLVAMAIENQGPYTYEQFQTFLDTGEMIWQSPESQHRMALLEEALKMLELGFPREFIWRRVGLDPDEIEEAERLWEEQQQREQEEAPAPSPSTLDSPDNPAEPLSESQA